MLYAEMQRVSNLDNQVILFNIDSRADPSEGRGAILSVLWKLFNEMQGFCPDYPYIAEIEKYLAQKGCYQDFCSTFQNITESDWMQERDAFELYEDEYLQNEIEAASSAAVKNKLNRELNTLKKKQAELNKFDEELRYFADQRISIDLDDGVKHNYGKFGNLLAEVKGITGKK